MPHLFLDGSFRSAALRFALTERHQCSKADIVDTASKWPLLRCFNQTTSDWVLSHILPLLSITFIIPQTMMKTSILKFSEFQTFLGKAIFPITNPAFDGELKLVWHTEEM